MHTSGAPPVATGESCFKPSAQKSTSGCWVLEYCTLTLCLVLGSYYSYLYLKSIYFFSRVYSKGRVGCDWLRLSADLRAGTLNPKP